MKPVQGLCPRRATSNRWISQTLTFSSQSLIKGTEDELLPPVRVVFYQEGHKDPIQDWISQLSSHEQDACYDRLERLRDQGHELGFPAAEHLGDGIWELRIRVRKVRLRMLYFFHKREAVVIAQGFHKDTRKVPPAEIKKAKERRARYEAARKFTPCIGSATMSEKKLSTDAVEWMYDRYIKDDPARIAHLELVRKQADLAQQIYDIREKFRMTREDLAGFSGLTAETVEDLEEADYDGDWDEAIRKVNLAFHTWFTNVILPASRMKPEDYSVGMVSA